MKIEGGKISSIQLYFLTLGYILGSSGILSIAEAISKQATWISVIIGLLEGLFFALIYLKLSSCFPGKSLLEIFQVVYGNIIGKFISFFYIIFFFLLTSLNMRYFGDFFILLVMPETPLLVFILLIALLCASAIRNGIEVIARCSFTLVFVTIFLYFLGNILVLKEMELSNLLPFFDISISKLLRGSHIIGSIIFGEVFIFTMIIPYLNNHKLAKRSILLALISGFLIIFIIAIQNITILGPLVSIYLYPTYNTFGLINIGDLLNRLEVFFIITLITTMFLKITIIYYATIIGSAQFFNLRTYLPLVLPIGALLIVISSISFTSNLEEAFFGESFFPIISMPFEVGIPLLTLIITYIRKKFK